MQRMHRFIVLTGLVSLACLSSAGSARADLLHPPSTPQTYPDIAATLGKGVSYTYDPTSQRGLFHLRNLAFALDNGSNTSDSNFYDIKPNANGDRYQDLQVVLDKNGNFVDDPGNKYQIFGSVTINGQTYSGLLLDGKPIAFSTVDTVVNGNHYTQFQADLKLSGQGLLSSLYGTNGYIHLVAEAGNTYIGRWDQDFNIQKVSSNTHGPNDIPQPAPIPEPTTLVFLTLSGVGVLYKHRKRLAQVS